MKKYMTQKDVIAFHGGGNIGDIYVHIELLRHRIAGDFQKNRFFVFPQTAHFTDTLFGKAILKKGSRAYLKNKELCIFAREEVSFNFLKNKLPKIKSELCPDIVMSLNMSEGQISRRGGLLCLRTDRESKLSIEDIIEVRRILNDKFDYVNTTDTYSTVEYINDENRMYEFERKIGIFKEYECVVTDRLHGMIFAAISGTPCVVLGNYNHKISSSYNWLKHLPYVKYIENIEALPNAVEEVRSTTGFTYDNSFGDKYYSKIVDYIKNI